MSRPARTLRALLAISFMGSLGYSVVLPVLVFVVARFGGGALLYGALGATYSVFQLVGAPLLGRWSDRVGRRRVLIVSQLGTLASWLVFLVALVLPPAALLTLPAAGGEAWVLTLPVLAILLARALDGLTGGNVSVAHAFVADVTAEDERPAAFGRMAVAGNVGFILGPALSGVLVAAAGGEWLAVLAAAGIAGIATVLVWRGLEEASPCVVEERLEESDVRRILGQEPRDCYRVAGPSSERSPVWTLPGVPPLLALHFTVYLAFNFFYVAFPVHAATGLGWDAARVGAFFVGLGAAMALAEGPLLAALSARVSGRTLVGLGSAVLAVGFLAFTRDSALAVVAGVALVALGNGTMWPSLLATIANAAGEQQGTVQGAAVGLAAVASIAGLLAGGLLYDRIGSMVFSWAAVLALAVAAATPLATRPVVTRSA